MKKTVMRWRLSFILIVLTSALPAFAADPGIEFFVSSQGSDDNPGTSDKPLASLEKARQQVRSRPAGTPARVVMQPGTFYLQKSFELTEKDGGTAEAPVTYQAAKPGTVRIIGGRPIAPGLLKPVTDQEVLARLPEAARGRVLAVTMDALDIPAPSPVSGVLAGNGNLFSLYENGELLPVARWPKEGFTTVQEVVDSGVKPVPHGGVFRYREERQAAWANAPKSDGWWVEGYWRVPWVMDGVHVESLDVANKTITLSAPVGNGIGSKYTAEVNGTRKGDGRERYRVRNLLEELEQPGEWVYRYSTKTLYLWPKTAGAADLTVVYSSQPVVAVKECSHLRLESLDIEGGQAGAVSVAGGADVRLLGCAVQNTPGNGIEIKSGKKHQIVSCDVCNVGAFGIRVDGGNRKTLEPGEFQILNNHVHHYGLIQRTVCGVEIRGVGHHVANNLLHDSPYGGILYGGNDHLIELNEVHNFGLEGGDVGGLYTGADWTSWGNLVRYNFVHHASIGNGVYLDDGDSGDEVFGNLFYKIASGPFVGGGSMNKVRNNFVVECKVGVHLDDRGISRKYGAKTSSHQRNAKEFNILHEPWASKYPELAAWYQTQDLGKPTGDVIERNVFVNCGKGCDNRSGKENQKLFAIRDNLDLEKNPGFANPELLDFTIDPKNAIFAKAGEKPAIEPIPFAKMGLYRDGWRRELPTAEATGRLTQRKVALAFDSNTDIKQSNQNALKKVVKP